MLSKTFLVLLLLHVKYIIANSEDQYVEMEVPIEVFEPIMENCRILLIKDILKDIIVILDDP